MNSIQVASLLLYGLTWLSVCQIAYAEEISYGCSTPPYNPSGSGRSASKDNIELWDGGVVPYQFKDSINLDVKKTFLKAVKQIEQATCLIFKERTAEPAFISVESICDCNKADACSKSGWVSGGLGKKSPSRMTIDGCISPDSASDVGFLVHEIGHSLGLVHTQTRPDRDEYVRVNQDNIKPDASSQYQYKKCDACLTYGTAYDCMSVMHYRNYFFQKDGAGPTMTAMAQGCDLETYPQKLAASDIDLLNKMYPCKAITVDEITASSTYNNKGANWGPHYGIDGKTSPSAYKILHTKADSFSWAQLRLSSPTLVTGVEVINRADCCGDRLKNLEIRAGLASVPSGANGNIPFKLNKRVGYFAGPGVNGKTYKIMFPSPVLAQFITLQLTGRDRQYLNLNEIKVLGRANKESDIRLSSYPKGRVELYKNGQWGTLCGHFWWDNNKGAENICKQLGYAGGSKYTAPGGFGPIQAGNRLCRGGEATVWDCPLKRPELRDCTHAIDQGVNCT